MALTIMNVCLACVIFRYDFGVGGFKRMGVLPIEIAASLCSSQ